MQPNAKSPLRWLAPLLCVASTGCVTPMGADPAVEARTQNELGNLRADVTAVAERQQRADLQVQAMQEDLRANRQALEQKIATLEQRCAAQEEQARQARQQAQQDRETLRTEIVDALSRRMADVLQAQSARSPAPSRAANSAGPGTHTVQPGDTLSKIASAYGIPAARLAEVNAITNPDTIRVGQVLKIP